MHWGVPSHNHWRVSLSGGCVWEGGRFGAVPSPPPLMNRPGHSHTESGGHRYYWAGGREGVPALPSLPSGLCSLWTGSLLSGEKPGSEHRTETDGFSAFQGRGAEELGFSLGTQTPAGSASVGSHRVGGPSSKPDTGPSKPTPGVCSVVVLTVIAQAFLLVHLETLQPTPPPPPHSTTSRSWFGSEMSPRGLNLMASI